VSACLHTFIIMVRNRTVSYCSWSLENNINVCLLLSTTLDPTFNYYTWLFVVINNSLFLDVFYMNCNLNKWREIISISFVCFCVQHQICIFNMLVSKPFIPALWDHFNQISLVSMWIIFLELPIKSSSKNIAMLFTSRLLRSHKTRI